MYYIINNIDQIIAADNALLNLLDFKSIEELAKTLILGDIHFSAHANKVLTVKVNQQEFNFDTHIFPLSSMLGDLRLIHLNIQEKPTMTQAMGQIDNLVLMRTENTPPIDSIHVSNTVVPDTTLQDTTPITIYIDEISQSIGITTEDYTMFLNEYIDTSISLESDLQGSNIEKRTLAIATLTQLADVLQLPKVNETMTKIAIQNEDEAKQTIAYFYLILSRLTTSRKGKGSLVDVSAKQDISLSNVQEDIKIDLPSTSGNGFGIINLNGVKPIPFNFSLDEAANDLSLPVELIKEFVYDFINQAEEETKNILVAHEKGDLDTIQKIGHMLKGASGNLRINALSDTLQEIQFCKNSHNLDGLIKRYWGHFLAFKQQINIISK